AAATFVVVAGVGALFSGPSQPAETVQAANAVDLDALVAAAQEREAAAARVVAPEPEEESDEVSEPEPSQVGDPLEPKVQEILALYQKGSKITAHHHMKKLAVGAPHSVAVARG